MKLLPFLILATLVVGCTAPTATKEEAKPVVAANQVKAQKLADEGVKVMNDLNLAPKDKYPKALDLYRQALKLDPENKTAAENKKMIEDIYESMGKPIPG